MSVLVVDASVVVPIVADVGSVGERYRHRVVDELLVAPDLMRIEAMSVLRRRVRSGVFDDEQAALAIESLLLLPIVVFPTVSLLEAGWGLRDNVSSYDACYVALAETLGCVLLTADVRLASAPGLSCEVELM